MDLNQLDSKQNLEKVGGSRAWLLKSRDPKHSPFLKRKLEHPTTDNQTLIHQIKGSLGTGVLAMPYAFSNAGIILGIPATLFIGFVCTYCVHMMVSAAQELCWRHGIPSLDFGEIGEIAMKNGPKQMHRFAGVARSMIKTFIVLVAFGSCCVYILFVAENIAAVANNYLGEGNELDLTLYSMMVTVVVLALSMVRNLRYLAPLSMISNVLLFSSIIIVLIYVFEDMPGIGEQPGFVSAARFPVFFSTAVFALEGITVIMPLENNMKTPEHYTGCFRVLNTAMTTIVCVYTLLGFFGFLKYGMEVEGSISLNLPSDEPLAQAAQIMLSIAIAFSYPLQFYVGIDYTWPTVKTALDRWLPRLSGLLGEYIYRVFMVLITMVVGIVIPNLSALMGLIGAVCIATVGIIFPPILETVVYWEYTGFNHWTFWKNFFIFIFGLVGFITGFYTSMKDIIEAF